MTGPAAPKLACDPPSEGGAWSQRGEYLLAILDYDEALKLYPRAAESLYGRGVAKRLSGNTQGGDLDLASAKQLQTDIVEVMARLGVRP